MTDSPLKQAVSSAWIENGVCVKESNYGDIKINGKWCGNELGKSLVTNGGMIENESHFMCKDQLGIFVPKIEDSSFLYDLSIKNNSNRESTNSCSNAHVKLNETFNISVGSSSQMEFYDYQIPETINDQTINLPTIKSMCCPDKSSFSQLDAENLKVLDKTINLSTLDSEYVSEKVFPRFDSEESLGIIPEVLENSWELSGSCSDILNKDNCSTETDHEISEVFSLPSLNCHDLKNQCFEYINRHLEKNGNGSNYTSTPKVLKDCIDSDSLQHKLCFPSNEGVKVDEPIIAGSSRTVSEILDAEEFDNDKILTSTSKLSHLLPIHNSDSLNKTSNLDCKNFSFTYQEVNGVCNLTEASIETLEIHKECKDLKVFKSLHHRDVINSTFEVKPGSPQMFTNENYFGASPILHEKSNSLNKTITINNLNNTSGMYNGGIRSSLELNRTLTLKSSNGLNGHCLNTRYSEITENQTSYNMQLNECIAPATEVNSLCRTLIKSKDYYSPENISLSINNSYSSFKSAAKGTGLTSKINTCKKNGEFQTKQSVSERFNKRYSLSAYPTSQKPNSFKLNSLAKSLPVSLKADYLQNSKQRLSSSKLKGSGNELPKKCTKTASTACLPKPVKADTLTKSLPVSSKADYLHSSKQRLSSSKFKGSGNELPKKFTKAVSTACLPKPVKADTFGKIKSVNTCRRSNSLGLRGIAVQSKEFKCDEACLKSTVGFQAKAAVKTLPNDNIITNDISRRLSLQKRTIRSDHGLLKSCTEGNYNSKDKNETFSVSDEIYDKKNTTVCQKTSSNGRAVQFKESPTVSKIVNKGSLKSKTVIQTEAAIKSSLNCPFVKKDFSNNFCSQKISDGSFSKPPKTNNHSKDKQTLTASDDFYVSKNATLNIQERSEAKSDMSSQHINDHIVQTEELTTQNSAMELVNLTKTKSDNSVADILNKNFVDLSNDSSNKSLKGTSEKSTKNKNINSIVPLKNHVKGIFSKPVGRPKLKCSFSSNISESKNDLTMQIKESPTDNFVTNVLNDTFVDTCNDTCGKSSKDTLTKECKKLNSNASAKHCVKNIFSKPANKQRLSFMPTLKSKDESNLCKSKGGCKNELTESIQDSSEISSKSKNDHTVQIKELPPADILVRDIVNLTVTKCEDSTTDVLSKTLIDMPNDSLGKSFKDISEKSVEESSIVNAKVPLKGRVKGIFSIPVNKQRLSFLPTLKSQVFRENKDGCKERNIENELPGPSCISSKQCGKDIQIPKFHLKSKSGHVKKAEGLERKPLQKENIESNFLAMGVKDSQLKSYESGNNGKFSHTRRVFQPLKRNASNVVSAPIPKKISSGSVKLKPVHRIPSSVAHRQNLPIQKTQAPASQQIR